MNEFAALMTALVVGNIGLTRFVGVSPLLTKTLSRKSVLTHSLVSCLVIFLASVAAHFVDLALISGGPKLAYLDALIYIAIVLILFALVSFVGKHLGVNQDSAMLVYFNASILFLMMNQASLTLSVAAALLYALGSGLGFACFYWIAESMNARLHVVDAPYGFKGEALLLLSLGIFAYAISGLIGIV